MTRFSILFIVIQTITSISFSQTYSKDNKQFVYQNRITYRIIEKEAGQERKGKLFLNIFKNKNEDLVELKTIELNSKIQDFDMISFGDFIDEKRKFILLNTRNSFYILNFYNNKLLGPYSPKFWGIGQDAQSGMLTDLKIIMQGRFLIGYCVDSGTFLYDLTNLYKPIDAVSASIPIYNENHVYVLNRAENKQKQFALHVSTSNWKVNYKLILNNKSLSFEDYSHINRFSDIEIEEKLVNYSKVEHKYTLLKEVFKENQYKYLIIDNADGKIIKLPFKIARSGKKELVTYLEKL